jgi:hypothetical protein
MASPLARPAARVAQTFSATGAKHPVRRLHVTATASGSQQMQFERAVAAIPKSGYVSKLFQVSLSHDPINRTCAVDNARVPNLSLNDC